MVDKGEYVDSYGIKVKHFLLKIGFWWRRRRRVINRFRYRGEFSSFGRLGRGRNGVCFGGKGGKMKGS